MEDFKRGQVQGLADAAGCTHRFVKDCDCAPEVEETHEYKFGWYDAFLRRLRGQYPLWAVDAEQIFP